MTILSKCSVSRCYSVAIVAVAVAVAFAVAVAVVVVAIAVIVAAGFCSLTIMFQAFIFDLISHCCSSCHAALP